MRNTNGSIGLAFLLVGCSGSPTASSGTDKFQHLIVAPQFQYCSTCDKNETFNIDGDVSTTVTHLCLDEQDCSTLNDSSYGTVVSGSALSTYTVYDRLTLFEGTCAKSVAISCANRHASDACETCLYTICCERAALCEDDPNCVAITDCVVQCGADSSCGDQCVTRGDAVASANFLGQASVHDVAMLGPVRRLG
jgi:hypothetical protein